MRSAPLKPLSQRSIHERRQRPQVRVRSRYVRPVRLSWILTRAPVCITPPINRLPLLKSPLECRQRVPLKSRQVGLLFRPGDKLHGIGFRCICLEERSTKTVLQQIHYCHCYGRVSYSQCSNVSEYEKRGSPIHPPAHRCRWSEEDVQNILQL